MNNEVFDISPKKGKRKIELPFENERKMANRDSFDRNMHIFYDYK
jgi:hypothetical protein